MLAALPCTRHAGAWPSSSPASGAAIRRVPERVIQAYRRESCHQATRRRRNGKLRRRLVHNRSILAEQWSNGTAAQMGKMASFQVVIVGCPHASDGLFGPRVDPDCRPFDFTLQFEDLLLACMPNTLFLMLSIASIASRLRRPRSFSLRRRLVLTKAVRPLPGLVWSNVLTDFGH